MRHTKTSLRRHARALDNWDKYVPNCGEIMDALNWCADQIEAWQQPKADDRTAAKKALSEAQAHTAYPDGDDERWSDEFLANLESRGYSVKRMTE